MTSWPVSMRFMTTLIMYGTAACSCAPWPVRGTVPLFVKPVQNNTLLCTVYPPQARPPPPPPPPGVPHSCWSAHRCCVVMQLEEGKAFVVEAVWTARLKLYHHLSIIWRNSSSSSSSSSRHSVSSGGGRRQQECHRVPTRCSGLKLYDRLGIIWGNSGGSGSNHRP